MPLYHIPVFPWQIRRSERRLQPHIKNKEEKK